MFKEARRSPQCFQPPFHALLLTKKSGQNARLVRACASAHANVHMHAHLHARTFLRVQVCMHARCADSVDVLDTSFMTPLRADELRMAELRMYELRMAELERRHL